MQKKYKGGANKALSYQGIVNSKVMASKHSQPLLQETSESEAENCEGDVINDGNDDSITNNLDKELLRSGQNAPHDKYSFNYIIFYLMGMTTLLPWNFFITAEDVSNTNLFVCVLQKLFSVSH